MNDAKVTFRDNPELFEQTLRQNLSSSNHTQQSLIDFGVSQAIEASRLDIELSKEIEKHGKLLRELTLATQLMVNLKSWSIEDLAKTLERDFSACYIANLIRQSKIKAFKHNKNNAQANRKPLPTKEDVHNFRTKWINEYEAKHKVARTNGWRKKCADEFKISTKTLKGIYP